MDEFDNIDSNNRQQIESNSKTSNSEVKNPFEALLTPFGQTDPIKEIKIFQHDQQVTFDSNQSVTQDINQSELERDIQDPNKQKLYLIQWRNLQLQKTLINLAIQFEGIKQEKKEGQHNFFSLTQQQLKVLNDQQKVIAECLQKDNFGQNEIDELENYFAQATKKNEQIIESNQIKQDEEVTKLKKQ